MGHSWKKRLGFLFSLSLHQQLTIFLCPLFKDKQTNNYNVFYGIEDIKYILCNHHFTLNNIDVWLGCVEGSLILDSTSGNLMDSLVDLTLPIDSSSCDGMIDSSNPS